jgi:peptidoglycan/LPS O-acetylase OafA/YrhL
VLIVAGFLIRIAVGFADPPDTLVEWDLWIRKMVVSRSDAVAYGVLAAVWVDRYGRPPRWTLALAVLLIGWSVVLCSNLGWLASLSGWLILFPLAGAGFALLLPWLAELPAPPPLIDAPVRFIARISYALYIVHWSFVYIAAISPEPWRLTIYLAGSFITAAAVSYAIEYPIMRRRPSQVPEPPLGPLASRAPA